VGKIHTPSSGTPRFAGAVILSGQDGDDVRHYQEKQVRNAIREVSR